MEGFCTVWNVILLRSDITIIALTIISIFKTPYWANLYNWILDATVISCKPISKYAFRAKSNTLNTILWVLNTMCYLIANCQLNIKDLHLNFLSPQHRSTIVIETTEAILVIKRILPRSETQIEQRQCSSQCSLVWSWLGRLGDDREQFSRISHLIGDKNFKIQSWKH